MWANAQNSPNALNAQNTQFSKFQTCLKLKACLKCVSNTQVTQNDTILSIRLYKHVQTCFKVLNLQHDEILTC